MFGEKVICSNCGEEVKLKNMGYDGWVIACSCESIDITSCLKNRDIIDKYSLCGYWSDKE